MEGLRERPVRTEAARHVENVHPGAAAARHADDPQRGVEPPELEDAFEPFGLGHDDVGDHHVRAVLPEFLDADPAVLGLGHLMPAMFERDPDQGADRSLVIDHENLRHGRAPRCQAITTPGMHRCGCGGTVRARYRPAWSPASRETKWAGPRAGNPTRVQYSDAQRVAGSPRSR